MREFDTGATRDTDEDKLDYEGFLCPLALERYASYLHAHRKQVDGKMRDSDNWQKGIPLKVYLKSMFRHFVDLWKLSRGIITVDQKDGHFISRHEALCAILFNAFGMLHELEKEKIPRSLIIDLDYSGGTCAPSTTPPTQHKNISESILGAPTLPAPPTQYGGDE